MSLGGGGASRQLQELAQHIEAIEEEVEAVQTEIAALQSQKQDISEAIDAIEELDTGSTVQVPLGGGAFVRATVEEIDELIVDLGGGYTAEREQDGAISTLESKQDTLDDRIEDLQSEVAQLETEGEELEERAQQMQAQQMQQQVQQQRGQQPDE